MSGPPPGYNYDQDQWNNIYYLVRRGYGLGAPYLAILAALCAGKGENNFHTHGCNHSNHCGLWQVGSDWQRQRSYTDVEYWTSWAYQHGFYGRGGLIHLADAYPNNSPGWIANQCQGAYANATQGANYYERFVVEGNRLYNYWWPRIAGGGSGGGSGYVQFGPTVSGISRVDDGIDMTLTRDPVALADGRVLWRDDHQWAPWGAFLVLSIDSGSRAGWRYYIAEGVSPIVHIGHTVKAGQTIARRARNGGNGIVGNIEAGWAGFHNDRRTLAQERGHGGQVPSPEGSDFRAFYLGIAASGGGGGGGGIIPETASLLEAIAADDWSGWLFYGATVMHARALRGYLWSQRALHDCQSIDTFTKTGGR